MDRGQLYIASSERKRSRYEPESVPVRQIRIGNFYLTQARWYRSGTYGSYSMETGIRDLVGDHGFTLIQHFDLNFDDALDEITWRLEAGHDPWEIERDVCGLKTEPVKATLL